MHPVDGVASEESLTLRNAAGDEALVSAHGAQLLSWRPAGAEEQVYLSPLSRPGAGVAVRGGAPICFPQFSTRGPLPRHGFARTSRWTLVAAPAPQAEVAEARFQLDSSMVAGDRAFCLVLVARLGPRWLELQLQVANTGRSNWDFTAAIHTYFQLADLRAVSLAGLQGLEYEDMVQEGAVRRESAAALGFDGSEIDRVYRDASRALSLREPGAPGRRIVQQGFTDVVVWNPGPAKVATFADLPAQDWARMLCVEAGAIACPVELAPGTTWRGTQRIELGESA
jgi:glucose-6-phosphate 1-epimerase